MTDDTARQPAILDAALDCVIVIDIAGCIVSFNGSAERTFGYTAAEAVGRPLADVIVPPSGRAAHRKGFARYLKTRHPRIIGRRIELTAMRADGTEFPVELTVTTTESNAELGFIGFVRDITERVEGEEELRAAHRRVEGFANEQAALRRVATLVARQATAEELFASVAEEGAHVLGVPGTSVVRYDGDGAATLVGVSGDVMPFALGTSWPPDETVLAGVIWRTRQPASVDLVQHRREPSASLLACGLRYATGVPITVEGRVWGAMLALENDGRTTSPADVIDRLQSFTELIATAVSNAAARSDLVAARRRVIDAADATRERLTRDIHDGAQQQFVTALINLQRAQDKWSADPERARELLDHATTDVEAGVETLRELAAGVHPAILRDIGLVAALQTLTSRVRIPVTLDVAELHLPPRLAVSAYFFCAEALTNVVKHAAASSAVIRVATTEDELTIEVRDDGVGGATLTSAGSGLIGLHDRIGALEGSIALTSPPAGPGTVLAARIPLRRPSASSGL